MDTGLSTGNAQCGLAEKCMERHTGKTIKV